VLINAFKQLNLPDVRLKIYGSFDHYPDYVASLKTLVVDCDAIEFCGTFPNQQIAQVLSELDALVVPSIWYENTPLVVYSALAARCPVVASNFSGMSEVVRHEENGLLFTAGDAQHLAEALRSLATTADLLPRLSANCQPPKSTVQYVDEIEAVYQQDLAATR
jgi:glycosyltransferase involved in cell wall biosynthesis